MERHHLVEPPEPGDHLLEIILALGAHADRVSLDLPLRLGELVAEDFRDLPRQVVRQATPKLDPLAKLEAARLLDVAPNEDLEREVAPDGLRFDEVPD